MQDFVSNFKSWVKIKHVRTDNNVFKLHYKFTVIMLLAFSILLSSKQYFGDPIQCDGPVESKVMNVFCWISGTFTLSDIDAYQQESNLRGIRNEYHRNDPTKLNILLYYQWIFLLFALQALLFYVPRYLWKSWENNELHELIKDFRGPLVSEKWSPIYNANLVGYLVKGENHNVKALRFAFCELLNFGNVIGQMFIVDLYLNKKFRTYGIDIFTKAWPAATDMLFPKRAKCIYTNYGPSGDIQKQDALCVLPLNILNEKVFLVLWFWLIFLLIVSFGSLVYRLLFLTCRPFRGYLLLAQVKRFNRKKLIFMANNLSFGQIFLAYNIGKNVSPVIYKEFLDGVYESFSCDKPHA